MQIGDLVKYKRSYQNMPIYGIVVYLGKASANCIVQLCGSNERDWKYLKDLEAVCK
mgnify:CR=1 FL=1